MPALPQPEPLCQLIQVKKGKIHGSYLLVRTRIVVNIPAAEFSVRLSRNENASPQTVIRISARSLQQLREKLNPEKLRQLVDETELEHLASIISTNPSKQNREMQQLVKKNFGISMNIPAEMQASKKAEELHLDFKQRQFGHEEPHPHESEEGRTREGKPILMLFLLKRSSRLTACSAQTCPAKPTACT